MITAAIDALKGRYVAVVDIPGAYLSADMDDKVHVVLQGTLCRTNGSHRPSTIKPLVSYATGRAVLYF